MQNHRKPIFFKFALICELFAKFGHSLRYLPRFDLYDGLHKIRTSFSVSIKKCNDMNVPI